MVPAEYLLRCSGLVAIKNAFSCHILLKMKMLPVQQKTIESSFYEPEWIWYVINCNICRTVDGTGRR